MTGDGVIQLNDVSFAYHAPQVVVEGVTVEASAGRLHVLIGPNGCGKSTLLKLMLGHLRPRTGRITLDGQRVHALAAAQRAAWISYVPQRAAVAFAFTVRQVVQIGRYALPDDPQVIEDVLGACDLRELADRPYSELSVGQQQRVLLARALAQSAGRGRLMLLDEPTSAMDLRHAHQSMKKLQDLGAEGMAAVCVVQELNLAARYADQVWLMDHGRIVAAGPWEQVLRPELLRPVYGVRVEQIDRPGQRPLFDVQLAKEDQGNPEIPVPE